MTVSMLRSAKYRDHDGRARFAGQYEDAMMPVPTAQRALRHGVAVSAADPRRAQRRGSRGGDFNPSASDVVDLDAIEEPKGVPYVGSDPALAEAHFTEIDRSGEARTIQTRFHGCDHAALAGFDTAQRDHDPPRWLDRRSGPHSSSRCGVDRPRDAQRRHGRQYPRTHAGPPQEGTRS